MKRLQCLVLGVLAAMFLSACDASVYSLPLPGGPDVGDDPITVKVEFADVLDLVPQSTVKVNDVSVGKVTGFEKDAVQAEPYPGAKQKVAYKVAVVKIADDLTGAGKMKEIKVGFVPPPKPDPKGPPRPVRPLPGRGGEPPLSLFLPPAFPQRVPTPVRIRHRLFLHDAAGARRAFQPRPAARSHGDGDPGTPLSPR